VLSPAGVIMTGSGQIGTVPAWPDDPSCPPTDMFATMPGVRPQRAFLGRTVHYLAAEAGIRQFLDIGRPT